MLITSVQVVLLSVLFSTLLLYANDSKGGYRGGKTSRIPALPGFEFFYGLVKVGTPVVVLLSFVAHPLLLKFEISEGWRIFGAVLAVLGHALAIASKKTLADSYSPCYDSFVPTRVAKTGPYKLIRHPIYLSNFGVLLGFLFATGSYWFLLFFVGLVVYYTTSAKFEERHLLALTPGYKEYYQSTGRFFPKLFRR
jgi:protein-S-isoprenylcysteine O-methyltransferase Ste14